MIQNDKGFSTTVWLTTLARVQMIPQLGVNGDVLSISEKASKQYGEILDGELPSFALEACPNRFGRETTKGSDAAWVMLAQLLSLTDA